jgi:hypothetical protein
MPETDSSSSERLQGFSTSRLIKELGVRSLSNAELEQLRKITEGSVHVADQRGETSESILSNLLNSIQRQSVTVRLPSGGNLNGSEINPAGGWRDFGTNIRVSRLDQRIASAYNNLSGEGRNKSVASSNVLSICDSPENPDCKVLTFYFCQDKKIVDARTHYTHAYVRAEIPLAIATVFMSQIKTNPDIAEDFYQSICNGLDATDGVHGARRVKSTGIFIIDGDTIEQSIKDKPEDQVDEYRRAAVYNVLSSPSNKLPYRNGPYGTGDAVDS